MSLEPLARLWQKLYGAWLTAETYRTNYLLREMAKVTWDFRVNPPLVTATPELPGLLGHPKSWKPRVLQDLVEGARTARKEDEHVIRFIEDPLALANSGGRIDFEFVLTQKGEPAWFALKADVFRHKGKLRRIDVVIMRVKGTVRPQYDDLTRILLRQPLLRHLDEALAWARPDSQIMLAKLDIIGFKSYNDIYGESAGDEVLVHFARRLEELVPEAKKLNVKATVGRLGGDEFLAICSGVSLGCVEQLQKLVMELTISTCTVETKRHGQQEIAVQANVGFSITGHPVTSDDLRKHSEIAFGAAKKNRANFSVYDPAVEEAALAELQTDGAIPGALLSQDISPLYEPIVNLQTGRIDRVEALARWWRLGAKGQEVVTPDSYLQRVGKLNLLVVHDSQMALQAANAIMALRSKHNIDLGLSVNLAPQTLENQDVLDNVVSVLDFTQLPPESLVLEITEEEGLDIDRAQPTLEALRKLGCRLAVDDFGKGESSFQRLRRLPFTDVKLDRSLICDLSTDPASQIILRHLIPMLLDLDICITAEGIEQPEQWYMLRDMGVNFGQGYLFGYFESGSAYSPEDLEAKLQKNPDSFENFLAIEPLVRSAHAASG